MLKLTSNRGFNYLNQGDVDVTQVPGFETIARQLGMGLRQAAIALDYRGEPESIYAGHRVVETIDDALAQCIRDMGCPIMFWNEKMVLDIVDQYPTLGALAKASASILASVVALPDGRDVLSLNTDAIEHGSVDQIKHILEHESVHIEQRRAGRLVVCGQGKTWTPTGQFVSHAETAHARSVLSVEDLIEWELNQPWEVEAYALHLGKGLYTSDTEAAIRARIAA